MSEYIYDTSRVETQPEQGFTGETVVRCRDCKRYNDQEPGGEIGTCNLGLEDLDLYSIVEPNGFCAWGERREK